MQEPSDQATDANYGFRIRQLERRPSPSSGNIIEYFRAYSYINNVTRTSGGSQSTVDWDFWEYCNTAVFEPRDTADQLDPTPGVDQVRRVRLLGDGRYTIFFGAVYAPSITGQVELAMHDGDSTWGFSDSICHGVSASFGASFRDFCISRVYPMLDPFGGTNAAPNLSFTVAQVNGAATTIDFNPLWMEIHYESNVDFCEPGSS